MPGIDHSADNTKVKLTLTGDSTDYDVDTLPNEWQVGQIHIRTAYYNSKC